MLAKTLALALALALAIAAPAVGKTTSMDDTVLKAATLVESDPAKALALVDPVIAGSEAMTPRPDSDYFCSDGLTNTLTGLMGRVGGKRNAIALSDSTCVALFVKGYALIDLGRRAEAEPFLRRATELAPDDAHYLNEYAEWWKNEHQWQKSYDLFSAAAALAPKQPEHERQRMHARSLRGMGFALIELGRLDDAERQFNASLKIEPNSPAALSELKYIAEQRAGAGGKPTS